MLVKINLLTYEYFFAIIKIIEKGSASMTLGDKIRFHRKALNLTQTELGKMLGVKVNAVSKWECGRVEDIPTSKIKALANIFGVPTSYLIDDDASIALDRDRSSYIRIPVLGRVAAGIPIDAIEEVIDWEDISADMAAGGAEYFGLQIKGDSMEPKISSGDTVIVRKQPDVESGEVAVVLVNGDDATVKRVKKSAAGITLIANNPAYDPVFYSNEDIEKLPVAILGRVVELRAKI